VTTLLPSLVNARHILLCLRVEAALCWARRYIYTYGNCRSIGLDAANPVFALVQLPLESAMVVIAGSTVRKPPYHEKYCQDAYMAGPLLILWRQLIDPVQAKKCLDDLIDLHTKILVQQLAHLLSIRSQGSERLPVRSKLSSMGLESPSWM